MKKATLIIWVIIFAVIALLIFQNQSFFMSNQSLRINLGLLPEYHTPELPIAILVLVFFLTGVLIAYLFSLSARFKARRTIKKLNTTIASHDSEILECKREIDSLKGIETSADSQAAETTGESGDTQKIATDTLAKQPTDQTGTFSIDSKAENPVDRSEETSDEKKD